MHFCGAFFEDASWAGTLITNGAFGAGFLPGLIAVVTIVAVIAYLVKKSNKNLANQYALKK